MQCRRQSSGRLNGEIKLIFPVSSIEAAQNGIMGDYDSPGQKWRAKVHADRRDPIIDCLEEAFGEAFVECWALE